MVGVAWREDEQAFDRDFLFTGILPHDLDRQIDQGMRVARLGAQMKFAVGNPGEIEQVVDDPRLQRDVPFDHAQLFPDLGGKPFVFAEAGRNDQHGRKRRAQFVREDSQKIVFRLVRSFRHLSGAPELGVHVAQRDFRGHALGDLNLRPRV